MSFTPICLTMIVNYIYKPEEVGEIMINPNHIKSFYPLNEHKGSEINFVDGSFLTVKESPQEIAKLLERIARS